jgi:nitrite reductase (NO-forming)
MNASRLIGPLATVALVAGALMFPLLRSGGSQAGAIGGGAGAIGGGGGAVPVSVTQRSLSEGILSTLPPKSSLQTVQGVKTVAPAVPPPVTRPDNRIVAYDLSVKETSAKIAPGLTYLSLWTFDGVVPGPVMRAKVGDVIRFTLHSDGKNVTSHNIDFHFVSGACGGCADTGVKPGEAKTIEVRALYPGLFMYHCAYNQDGNMAAVHIANGMYGFLIVDPAVPLPAVDHEFLLVESEFYVESAGKGRGVCSLQDLMAENPSYIFFNGKSAELNPPLTIRVNDRVRLYVGRGGVNGFAAFHVIGAIFDKVYPDGGTLDAPREHGIQTVTVPAGGATIVEFVAPVPGKLTAVDHNLSRDYFKGLGQVINVQGSASPEIYESLSSHDGQPHECQMDMSGIAAQERQAKP